MSAPDLSAYERWMVSSNLRTIRETGVSATEQAALVRANGYHRVADAILSYPPLPNTTLPKDQSPDETFGPRSIAALKREHDPRRSV